MFVLDSRDNLLSSISNQTVLVILIASSSKQQPSFFTLPIIVFSQFAGTSLWFATNAVMTDLQNTLQLDENALSSVTSAVQFGFIVGTLVFAILSIADRFSPSRVFMVCTFIGGLVNLGTLFVDNLSQLLVLRFAIGCFLAGVYPVGMKIAADWYGKGLGKALGYLVGALVLGTAFPHILKGFMTSLPWKAVIISTSVFAIVGGVLLAAGVGNGPYRSPSPKFSWKAIPNIFVYKDFRRAAFGYFGHMWELYAFWAFVPVMLGAYPNVSFSVPFWSGAVIGIGSLGCIAGGYMSVRYGSSKVAFLMLLTSGICCLISPWILTGTSGLFFGFLILWGFSVVGDSPQFSAVVANTSPKGYIGTALTIVNCIGFSITILSIQLLGFLSERWDPVYPYLILSLGPAVGLVSMYKLVRRGKV